MMSTMTQASQKSVPCMSMRTICSPEQIAKNACVHTTNTVAPPGLGLYQMADVMHHTHDCRVMEKRCQINSITPGLFMKGRKITPQ